MLRRNLQVVLACCCLGLAAATHAQALVTEVFELQNRSAEDVVKLMSPLVPAPGVVSGAGQQVIVRTTAENLQELLALLPTIDRAPTQFVVSVRQREQRVSHSPDDSAARQVNVDDGRREPRVRVYSTRPQHTGNDVQQIRVAEGENAFIQTGTNVSQSATQFLSDANAGRTYAGTFTTTDVASGFEVQVERLPGGKRVLVNIAGKKRRTARHDTRFLQPGIEHQAFHTTVRIALGQWVKIGRAHSSSDTLPGPRVRSVGTSRHAVRDVHIRVDISR